MTIILLLAFLLPSHLARVTSVPPVVVTKLTPATAFYVDEDGTIYACADQAYGLYIQPLSSKQIAFYYVAPPGRVQADAKNKYFVICLLVKP